MYLKQYDLNIKPFQITCDPKFLWLGEKHKEALAMLRYGVLENRGFLLLTGEVGTGKTLLINRLITMLSIDTVVATLSDPDLTRMDFYRMLADGLKMPASFNGKAEFLIQLREFLHKVAYDQQQVLLIIDEAQRLSHELMDDIRVLSNIEFFDRKLINIFFVGQPELNHILMHEPNRALAQRITIRYQIEPLNQDETAGYIHHRLKVAGTTKRIFKSSAIKKVFNYSGGLPRLINIICDHALLTGYAQNRKRINGHIITECVEELRIPTWRGSVSHFRSLTGYPERESVLPDTQMLKRFRLRVANGEIITQRVGRQLNRIGLNKWVYASIVMGVLTLWGSTLNNSREDLSTTPLESKLLYNQRTPALESLSPLLFVSEEAVALKNDRRSIKALKSKPHKPVPAPVTVKSASGYLGKPSVIKKKRSLVQKKLTKKSSKFQKPVNAPGIAKLESSQGKGETVVKKHQQAFSRQSPRSVSSSLKTGVRPSKVTIPMKRPQKESVYIQFDKTNRVAAKSKSMMDQVATYLMDFPDRIIYLRGFSNGDESSAQPRMLWLQRVNAVKNYLISKGAYAYQIEALDKAARRSSRREKRRPYSSVVIEFPQKYVSTEYNLDK